MHQFNVITKKSVSLIKSFKKKIPSFRHKKELFIFDHSSVFYKNKKTMKNTNFVKRKKFFYKNKSIIMNKIITRLSGLVTKKFVYQLKPYKKFILCQTINNINIYIPGIEFLTIGKILFNLKWMHEKNLNFYYKGFICYLGNVPLMSIFCNITNLSNNKITYAKAGGTYCILKKIKKSKSKLLNIILPSQHTVLLNKMTKVYIGKNTNFRISELTEGKWGFGFYKTKKIKVRGVAMNPVDHPNGGRTKTVQPEKSPWNWIAKKKK